MGEAWRKWKDKYGESWSKGSAEVRDPDDEKFETHFYVGIVHAHPRTWIIVGLFYPPRSAQRDLFE